MCTPPGAKTETNATVLMYVSAFNTLILSVHTCAYMHLNLPPFLSPALPSDHSTEVLQVVERANKEVAIEALLNTFEEVWLSRQLELVTIERTPLAINRQGVISHFQPSFLCFMHVHSCFFIFVLLHLFFTALFTLQLHTYTLTISDSSILSLTDGV